MPYNSVTEGFHTKKVCSRLSSNEVRFYTENGRLAFLSTLFSDSCLLNILSVVSCTQFEVSSVSKWAFVRNSFFGRLYKLDDRT